MLLVLSASLARAADDIVVKPDPALVQRFLQSLGSRAPANIAKASVPTVGCPADGQQGPLAAPQLAASVEVLLPPGQADLLAYYKADPTGGVLAPRGWKCFGRYGSDGDILTVAPPDAPAGTLTIDGTPPPGDAVVLTETEGSTSGRFEVAKIAARVFPAARAFVKGVQSEGMADPKDFVFGPWPRDTMARLSDRVVTFLTPAHAEGLGSEGFAGADAPILGFVALIGGLDQPSMRAVRARLATSIELYPAIALNALPAVDEKSSLEAPLVIRVAVERDDLGYRTLVVPRFGCSARYPAKIFSMPQPEADNGDGRTFLSNDGATLKIFGAYNALSQTPADMERAEVKDLGDNVSYHASGPKFYVMSGHRNGNVYYTRHIFSRDGGTICSFDLEYAPPTKGIYDGLAAALGPTLHAP